MEEPSSDFLKLRDYVDALDCRNLSAFSPENLRSGFSDKMVQQAREELKINKVKNDVETQVVIEMSWPHFFFDLHDSHFTMSPLLSYRFQILNFIYVEILPCSFSAGECMKFYVSV